MRGFQRCREWLPRYETNPFSLVMEQVAYGIYKAYCLDNRDGKVTEVVVGNINWNNLAKKFIEINPDTRQPLKA